jgi:hypothetical protein
MIPGTSCQATVVLSLRDKIHSRFPTQSGGFRAASERPALEESPPERGHGRFWDAFMTTFELRVTLGDQWNRDNLKGSDESAFSRSSGGGLRRGRFLPYQCTLSFAVARRVNVLVDESSRAFPR